MGMKRPRAAATALAMIALGTPSSSSASPTSACSTDTDCRRILGHPNSTCQTTIDETSGSGQPFRFCTNPYASGCLRSKLGHVAFPTFRTCNSDDANTQNNLDLLPTSSDNTQFQSEINNCTVSPFSYPEIRIAPGNWDSSIFQSFIMQIILSEMLGVPTSIETGSSQSRLSFYDVQASRYSYPSQAYAWDFLRTADKAPGGDCAAIIAQDNNQDNNNNQQQHQQQQKQKKKAEPCAHVIPEVWDGQWDVMAAARKDGYIDTSHTAMIGKVSWYLPKFVIESDPTLATYIGLRGEENRAKLADTFRRPTTWEEYCREVSGTQCQRPDEVAGRAPTAQEIQDGLGDKYRWVASNNTVIYRGHFRKTADSICVNETDGSALNCTGEIINAPCSWSTHVDQQSFHNNIHLSSSGPLEPNGGYGYGDMVDILNAAIDTRSSIIMWWFRPDAVLQTVAGTEGELLPVILQPPTEQCIEAKATSDDRCSDDPTIRRGEEEGSCDNPAHSLRLIIASSLARNTYAESEETRSPAYRTLQNLVISDLAIEEMFKHWVERKMDPNGFDQREAVCTWVSENIDAIKDAIPLGYPKTLETDAMWYESAKGLLFTGLALGVLTTIIVLTVAGLVGRYRRTQIMRVAQVDFLLIVLFGSLLLACAAITVVLEPSTGTCTSSEFLITLGYTLAIVPLLVKVEALLKIMREAKKMKRIRLTRKQLHGATAIVTILVTIYLVTWAILDPPTRVERFALNDPFDTSVKIDIQCASQSSAWKYASFAWEVVLIMWTIVLAYQTRNIRQEFNESKNLAMLVYAHFFFLVLRGIIFFLGEAGIFSGGQRASGLWSLCLSFDTISGICIYFVPKLLRLFKDESAAEVRTRQSFTESKISFYEDSSVSEHGTGTADRSNLHHDTSLTRVSKIWNEAYGKMATSLRNVSGRNVTQSSSGQPTTSPAPLPTIASRKSSHASSVSSLDNTNREDRKSVHWGGSDDKDHQEEAKEEISSNGG